MTGDTRIFCEVSSGFAIGCLALGFWLRRKETAARKWPQANGKIVTSRMDKVRVGHGSNEWLPMIEYEFTYNNASFKTSHWRAGNFSSGTKESTKAITEKYLAGTQVNVFVNPDAPLKSVLEYSATLMSWIPIGFGIAFFGFALLPMILKRM